MDLGERRIWKKSRIGEIADVVVLRVWFSPWLAWHSSDGRIPCSGVILTVSDDAFRRTDHCVETLTSLIQLNAEYVHAKLTYGSRKKFTKSCIEQQWIEDKKDTKCMHGLEGGFHRIVNNSPPTAASSNWTLQKRNDDPMMFLSWVGLEQTFLFSHLSYILDKLCVLHNTMYQ